MALHVLVPLDRSAYNRAARAMAIAIARGQPSRLTALRVVNVRPASGNFLEDLTGRLGFEPAVVPEEVATAQHAEATKMATTWAEEARAAGVGNVHPLVVVGGVADTILEQAQSADLVVMGLRGETEERFPKQGGAMAGWLPPRTDTPILWCTPGADKLESVAVGYDGSEGAKHATRAIRRLLAPLNLPVHAFYVSRDGAGGEVLGELDAELPDQPVIKHVVKGEDPHRTLVDAAEQIGAQVLVLGFRGRSPLKDFLFGTSTERILLSGRLAVLVAH